MAIPTTLVTIHDELEWFCREHKGIQRFEFEYEEQLPNLSTKGKTFPFVFAVPINLTPNGSVVEHTIRIFVYNRLDRDRSNVLDSTNDTSLIISDLIKWWNNENYNSNIELENLPFATTINNSQLDYLQGYQADFVFSVPSYSRCDIPKINGSRIIVDGEKIVDPYLTCSTLIDCPTIIDIKDDLNNFYIAINFEDVEDFSYVAPESFKINSIDNPDNISIVITVNGTPYTLGDTVSMYDKLEISSDSIGFIKLNNTRL